MKLSILIPTIKGREAQYNSLIESLEPQLTDDVEICVLKDDKENTIGKKRNILLQSAEGEYVAFADDDDRVTDNYVSLLMEGINKNVDCCSLKGVIRTNNMNPKLFEHSIKYTEWKTNSDSFKIKYERYPNHLNCIKAEIAKQFKFEEINHGEDKDWSTRIHESGLLKTEHYIEQVIYYYDFKTNK